MKRVLESARNGWQGAKANFIPGLVIAATAALLVAAYYAFPAVRERLTGLQNLRQAWGIWFSMLSSVIGAGLIPSLYLMATGKGRRDRRGAIDLLYICLVWALNAVIVDNFYTFQNWLWGSSLALTVLLAKVLFDQFVFTPFLAIQQIALFFRFRDLNYDVQALGRALRDDWIIKVIIPMLVAAWLTWLPGMLVIYALPLSLQFPMMVLLECFYALEIAFVSSKVEPVAKN